MTVKPLLFRLSGAEELAGGLRRELGLEEGKLEFRRFPDGESYLRFESPLAGRAVLLLDSLKGPDEKFLPLVFAAATARELGAVSVGLVAPYLAYMRQDKRFHPGEAVTSRHFAALLSGQLDWIVTADPHLHRYKSLDEIYSVPARVAEAAPLLAQWIEKEVKNPLLVGPDAESRQWVEAVAGLAHAPFIVLKKQRRGDRDVEVSVPEVERWRGHRPILVDDIISTGRTMIETVGHLLAAGMQPPVCLAVHAVFAGKAHEELLKAGAAEIVTCNSISHPSNRIDLSGVLAQTVRPFLPA
jgi:ribose-phosphate pyrophosphokinase